MCLITTWWCTTPLMFVCLFPPTIFTLYFQEKPSRGKKLGFFFILFFPREKQFYTINQKMLYWDGTCLFVCVYYWISRLLVYITSALLLWKVNGRKERRSWDGTSWRRRRSDLERKPQRRRRRMKETTKVVVGPNPPQIIRKEYGTDGTMYNKAALRESWWALWFVCTLKGTEEDPLQMTLQ